MAYWIAAIAVILIIIWRVIRSASPVKFAKSIAKTQMGCFTMLQSMEPNLPREELYARVIEQRPGYDRQLANSIIDSAKKLADHAEEPFGFNAVVIQLVANEYNRITGKPAVSVANELADGVLQVIPKGL